MVSESDLAESLTERALKTKGRPDILLLQMLRCVSRLPMTVMNSLRHELESLPVDRVMSLWMLVLFQAVQLVWSKPKVFLLVGEYLSERVAPLLQPHRLLIIFC